MRLVGFLERAGQPLKPLPFARDVRRTGRPPDQPGQIEPLSIRKGLTAIIGKVRGVLERPGVKWHALDVPIRRDRDDRRRVRDCQGIRSVTLVPHQAKSPARTENPREFPECLDRSKPVKRLRTEHKILRSLAKPRGFCSCIHPRHTAVRFRCCTHCSVGFNCSDLHAAIGQQPGRDSRARADVRSSNRGDVTQPVQHGINRGRGIRRSEPDVVVGAVAEAARRVQIVERLVREVAITWRLVLLGGDGSILLVPLPRTPLRRRKAGFGLRGRRIGFGWLILAR